MPGPNRAPRGGYKKPKDLKKTVGRLLGYLTQYCRSQWCGENYIIADHRNVG